MKKTLCIVAILSLSPIQGLLANEPDGVVISHYELLDDLPFGREQFGWAREARVGEPLPLAFNALGQRFELELEPNRRLLTQALRGRVRDEIGVFKGRITGRADSWVRLVVSNGIPSGLVWDGEEMFAIERRATGPDSGSVVIYRLRDVYVEPGTMSCGTSSEKTVDFATVHEGITAELNEAVVSAVSAGEVLNIGVVGDFEFAHVLGADAEAEILARVNNVDGIFSEQLGVHITAREVDTFLVTNDPFTSASPQTLLGELASYRLNTPTQVEQGITYLFTGRDLEGTAVGLAYTGELCSAHFGVGLGEARRGVTTDSLIAAHEIGHIFGAEHDGEAGSVCESETGEFLMAPRINNSDQFSSCSIETMRPNIEAASCINPMPEADVSMELASATQNLILGDNVDLDFDVLNNGTLDAMNVTARIDIPTNLTLNSITPSTGSCSSGAGQVDCTLGTIAGLGSERVTLAVTAGTEGTSTLSASVAADNDTNPGNNDQAVQIAVIDATDLLVRGEGGANVTVDSSLSIASTVQNVSALDATNVALTVSFSSGLRVDSATWPDGTCTISAGTVECQRATLAAQSQVDVSIELTATSAGSQSYTAIISSSEVDRDLSNNSATGTITVAAVSSGNSSGDSDSGGGAFGLLWLVLLSLIRLSAGVLGSMRRTAAS